MEPSESSFNKNLSYLQIFIDKEIQRFKEKLPSDVSDYFINLVLDEILIQMNGRLVQQLLDNEIFIGFTFNQALMDKNVEVLKNPNTLMVAIKDLAIELCIRFNGEGLFLENGYFPFILTTYASNVLVLQFTKQDAIENNIKISMNLTPFCTF